MKLMLGVVLFCSSVAAVLWAIVRITTDALDWFAWSGAGDVLGWSLVVALVVSFAAIPVGVWGLAARMWVVKLERGQYLVSTAHTLAPPHVVVAQLGTTAPAPTLTAPVEAAVRPPR